MNFSTRLRELRKTKKISQTVLGKGVGVTLKQIQRYESGENAPTLSVLAALADYLEVPVTYLMGTKSTNLTRAILRKADMREVKACGAIFVEADLSGADLRNSDLRWADFTRANLQDARLEGAKLDGAIFTGANVAGTILEKKN